MARSLVPIAFAVAIGVLGYVIGMSLSGRVPDGPDSPPSAGPATRDAGSRQPDADERLDALLRETREENRVLRDAIAELSAELKELRKATQGPAASSAAVVPATEWTARLRAREPDVVIDSVCRLRERMLTRALRLDDAAKVELRQIRGATNEEIDQIRRNHAAQVESYRADAKRLRGALEELDSVRTLEDLSSWRHRNGVADDE